MNNNLNSKTKKENDKNLISLENKKNLKLLKEQAKKQKQLTKLYSKKILKGEIISTLKNQINVKENVVELYDVIKSYTTGEIEYKVLKGINLKIPRGQLVVILGPSGSGKTTLLNILSGLDKSSSGDVFVDGYNLSLLKDSHLTKFRRDKIGFIFQQYNLLPNLTAKENAEVGENLAKIKNKEMTIEDIFQVIGMQADMNKYPQQLSGGQQQRVSIARAISKNPSILFCDEPTGALDEKMGKTVLEILKNINSKYKTTIIMVTHNPNIAKIADIVIHVKNGNIDEFKVNRNPINPQDVDWA